MSRGLGLLVVAVCLFACAPVRQGGANLASDTAGATTDMFALTFNEFALKVYKQAHQHGDNTYISPYGLASALAMVYVGASGKTAEEFASALMISPGNRSAMHKAVFDLNTSLNANQAAHAYDLAIANRLFAQKGYAFKADFLAVTRDRYQAPLVESDFKANADKERRAINGWVKGATKGKIPELLPSGFLTADARLVLINAIYAKGNWFMPFAAASNLKDQEFTGEDGSKFPLTLMQQTKKQGYFDDPALKVQVLERPLSSKVGSPSSLSMFYVLPAAGQSLKDLEDSLTLEQLDGLVKNIAPHDVHVQLPKYSLSSGMNDAQARKVLEDLGITSAFTENAGFDGIAEPKDSQGRKQQLYLSKVIQKTFISQGETGIETAAATGAAMFNVVHDREYKDLKTFRADRPYLYFLRDKKTGIILFIGRIASQKDLKLKS